MVFSPQIGNSTASINRSSIEKWLRGPKDSLKETRDRIITACSASWDLNHYIVSQAIAVCIDRRCGIAWVAIRYKDLRMIEGGHLIEHALVSKRLQKRNYRIDLIGR